MKSFLLFLLSLFLPFKEACAEWTPMITAGDFTGITTDVSTCATGIITICLIIVALAMILRAFAR